MYDKNAKDESKRRASLGYPFDSSSICLRNETRRSSLQNRENLHFIPEQKLISDENINKQTCLNHASTDINKMEIQKRISESNDHSNLSHTPLNRYMSTYSDNHPTKIESSSHLHNDHKHHYHHHHHHHQGHPHKHQYLGQESNNHQRRSGVVNAYKPYEFEDDSLLHEDGRDFDTRSITQGNRQYVKAYLSAQQSWSPSSNQLYTSELRPRVYSDTDNMRKAAQKHKLKKMTESNER